MKRQRLKCGCEPPTELLMPGKLCDVGNDLQLVVEHRHARAIAGRQNNDTEEP